MVNSNWNINVWRNVSNLNSDEGGLLVKPGRRSWQWRTGAVFRQIPHFTSLIGVTHQILLPPTFHHHHSWSSSKLSSLIIILVIIKTFIAVKILITDDHDQNSLCLDCTWKGQSICLCSYCGSNQQKNGTSRSTELRSANVSWTQISICRMKVKYQKWLYREMIKFVSSVSYLNYELV